MPINLPDIRAAVSAYVSALSPTITTPVKPAPGNVYRCNVSVSNPGPPNGIKLIRVIYEVSVGPANVAKFRGWGDAKAAYATLNDAQNNTNPLVAASVAAAPLSALFLVAKNVIVIVPFPFPVDSGSELGVPDTDTITGLEIVEQAQLGSAVVHCRVHADPDLDWLFPKNDVSTDVTRTFITA
jgi:hypothetical protein